MLLGTTTNVRDHALRDLASHIHRNAILEDQSKQSGSQVCGFDRSLHLVSGQWHVVR